MLISPAHGPIYHRVGVGRPIKEWEGFLDAPDQWCTNMSNVPISRYISSSLGICKLQISTPELDGPAFIALRTGYILLCERKRVKQAEIHFGRELASLVELAAVPATVFGSAAISEFESMIVFWISFF